MIRKNKDNITVCFAGNSGDGIQFCGMQFANNIAFQLYKFITYSYFPAEIRAPAGTLSGISSFYITFGQSNQYVLSDDIDILVAFNPAALKLYIDKLSNINDRVIIIDIDQFTTLNLKKASIEDLTLNRYFDSFDIHKIQITKIIRALLSTSKLDIDTKSAMKSRNLFALGFVLWLCDQPINNTVELIEEKFKFQNSVLKEFNISSLKSGYSYADTIECTKFIAFKEDDNTLIKDDLIKKNVVSGNDNIVNGLIAASYLSNLSLFFGAYPITPASTLLHKLSKYNNEFINTFQAEDEISALGVSIGAAVGGALAVTATSGPGLSLKSEMLGLAVMAEIPIVICNIQRAGPSTGMPSKTEQGDLLQSIFGRHGESPLVVIAPSTPIDCFDIAVLAVRVAITFKTPVILLSDFLLAHSSMLCSVPDITKMEIIETNILNILEEDDNKYKRNNNLVKSWIPFGTPNGMHMVSSLECDQFGEVSYDGINHERMVKLRDKKVKNVVNFIGNKAFIYNKNTKNKDADILFVSWGSVFGTINEVMRILSYDGGINSDLIHLYLLNPFPYIIDDIIYKYINRNVKIIIPEINLGQLSLLFRSRYLCNVFQYNKIRGDKLNINDLYKYVKYVLNNNE